MSPAARMMAVSSAMASLAVAVCAGGRIAVGVRRSWSVPTGGQVFASPTVANGVVYVDCWGAHKLYAFDAATGTKRWSAATSGALFSSPAVVDGRVYVGSNDGNLYAYRL